MGRRVAGSLLSFLAVIALGVAASTWISLRTVLDSDRVESVADQVLTEPAVANIMTGWIDSSLEQSIPPGSGLDAQTRRAIVAKAYEDPKARATLSNLLVGVHRFVVSGERDKLDVIDTTALSAALTTSAQTIAPQFASVVALPDLEVSIPTDDLPSYAINDRIQTIFNFSVVAAIACIGGALALHPRRDRVLSRIGKWAVLTGAFYYVSFGLLPGFVSDRVDADSPARVATTLVKALGETVTPTAVTLIIIGVVLIGAASVWKHTIRDANKYSDTNPRTPNKKPQNATAPSRAPSPVVTNPNLAAQHDSYNGTIGPTVADAYGRSAHVPAFGAPHPDVVAPPQNFFAGTASGYAVPTTTAGLGATPLVNVEHIEPYRDQTLPTGEPYRDRPSPEPRHAVDTP